jgi:Co/Zn/Cd efflux system component
MCPAPAKPCICEAQLYATTGTLALIAGLVQWSVGYRYSMAALSDSLHALADALADFVGMGIASKAYGNPLHDKQLRTTGNKIISILLALGAVIIVEEAYSRWHGDAYTVWLPAVVLVGLFGLGIDLLRFHMLTKAREHSRNDTVSGLIEHAKSDAWHSGIISVIALLAISGGSLGLEGGLYAFLVRLMDYLASLGLAGYMMFVLTPRIWRGEGCGHNHSKEDTELHHVHGKNCHHKH